MSNMVEDFSNHEIHSAAYYGNICTVTQLITDGHDVNCRNKKGNTPLMMVLLGSANKKMKGEILDYLLNSGADVNAVNEDGDPTLHVAVKASAYKVISKEIIQTLLDHGADNTLVNKCGKTAAQLAYQVGNVKLGNLLLFYVRPTDNVSTYSNKATYEKLTSKKNQLEKPTRKKKSPGLMRALLTCMFPACAFHRQLQEDFAEIERNRKTQIPSSEIVPKSVQTDSEKINGSEENTTTHLHLCNGSLLVEGKNGNVMIHQHQNEKNSGIVIGHVHLNENNEGNMIKQITLNESENVNTKEEEQPNEVHDDTKSHDLVEIEKTNTATEICNNENYARNTKYLNGNVHQLSHIGNECIITHKNDGKVHQLSHIGKECNVGYKSDDDTNCYIYA